MFIKISKPKYEVHANVLISQEEGKGMSSFGGLGDIFGSSGYVEDEIFVINSHSVLRDVARDLGTYRTHIVKTGIISKVFKYKKFPVEVYPAPGIVDTLLTTVSFAADVRADGIADITVKAAGKKIAEFEEQNYRQHLRPNTAPLWLIAPKITPQAKTSIRQYMSPDMMWLPKTWPPKSSPP